MRTGPDGVPDAVWLRGGWVAVHAVANCWRVETGWWRSEPDAAVARDVYRVGLADGRCADLAKDRLRGGWRCLRTWG